MSKVEVVIYEEIVDSKCEAEFYLCVRGLEDTHPKMRKNSIFLLWSGRTAVIKESNHYDVIDRSHYLASLITTFRNKFFPKVLGPDDLSSTAWDPKDPHKGNNKNEPEKFEDIVEYDYFKAFYVENINNLEIWEFTRFSQQTVSFYTLKNKNQKLKNKGLQVNFTNFLQKKRDSPHIERCLSKNME